MSAIPPAQVSQEDQIPMDPNMNHSDAERTNDSTDSSPGGVQTFEQPAAHEVPLPQSPPDSEGRVAHHAALGALQRRAAEQREDGSWVELPEDMHADIAEMLGRHQYDPLDFDGDTMVLEIENGQIVGMHPVNAADPSGQEILAVIRQLVSEPGVP
ncbi:hypothetical protein VP01_156g3 [Puccinia sorghi]|uniref:Uncharacterized protein n=1 Tax=Puccinia sorghi TaxID=27349 RepID=A0A0L6VJL8_9BASI|nr:hypothetical protein VP01_156g3 [Puccinia sorghi]